MRRLFQLLLLLTAVPLAADEVYKSTDANGNVVYSDRPQPGAETVDVQAPYLGGGPAPREPLIPEEPGSDEAGSEEASGEPEPSAQERAELRAQNCETAQERQERYMTSRRLYRTTPDGEREYLSSEEIDEARAQAAADVEEWCN